MRNIQTTQHKITATDKMIVRNDYRVEFADYNFNSKLPCGEIGSGSGG